MNIKIEVLPNSYEEDEGFPYCVGKITINEKNEIEPFWETFDMPLNYWTIEDYKKQWKEGLKRIKTQDVSCLVTSVENPKSRALINWWPLYKKDNEIYIQNELIVGEDYKNYIGNKTFSPETCYDFITSLVLSNEEGNQYSTWVVNFNEK